MKAALKNASVVTISLGAVLWIGIALGAANEEIWKAAQCERSGAFYVGDRVYECKLKEGK